jgi:hypothetical protein
MQVNVRLTVWGVDFEHGHADDDRSASTAASQRSDSLTSTAFVSGV